MQQVIHGFHNPPEPVDKCCKLCPWGKLDFCKRGDSINYEGVSLFKSRKEFRPALFFPKSIGPNF